jgi:hypothetical protein
MDLKSEASPEVKIWNPKDLDGKLKCKFVRSNVKILKFKCNALMQHFEVDKSETKFEFTSLQRL